MLSVILPNFNHGRLIDRAISALLEQKLLPDEIVIIDDGSTDNSPAIIQQLAATSSRIRVELNRKNLGVVSSQNIGLEKSCEPYIYFAAADDWVMPGFFELAISMLEAHPHSGLFCGESILIDGADGRELGMRPIARPRNTAGYIDAKSTRRLLTRTDNWILTGATVFRRDAILAAGGLDPDLGSFADGYLARKVALTHGFIFSPTVVSTWSIFETGVSRVTALELSRAQKVLQVAPDRIRRDPAFPYWYAELFQKRWRFSVCRLALEAKPIDRFLLLSVGAVSSLDRAMFKMISVALHPPPGRIAILAWLWIRLHPTSILALLKTTISRRFELLSRRRAASRYARARM
jgi:glycosyltransferase involved in cell wall biosynthesis